MSRLTSLTRRVRRGFHARRRLLAGVAAAAAVAVGLQAASPPPPALAPVLVAARDLPGGAVLGADDLRRVTFPAANVPAGTFRSAGHVLGRTTTSPLREGEPLTDVRLVAGSLLAGHPGAVAAPVRISDAGAVALLRVGDRVDVLGADPQSGRSAVVAHGVPVIAVPRAAGPGDDLMSGALVVLAVSPETALALAGAGVSSYLSVALVR